MSDTTAARQQLTPYVHIYPLAKDDGPNIRADLYLAGPESVVSHQIVEKVRFEGELNDDGAAGIATKLAAQEDGHRELWRKLNQFAIDRGLKSFDFDDFCDCASAEQGTRYIATDN
jgi:hypothetical protein